MSIRDYNKIYYVKNVLLNKNRVVIPHVDLFDNVKLDYKVSVGDYLLLKYVKSILYDDSDCLITSGYKE